MRRNITAVAMAAAMALSSTAGANAFECFPYGGGPEREAEPQGAGPMRKSIMRVDKLGNSKWDNTDGHDLREVPTDGTLDVLVILVNFKDQKFTVGSGDPRGVVDDMLNLPGFSKYGATGSAFDFYNQSSCGQFSPKFHVYGPVEMSKNEVDYVKTDETYKDPETGKDVAVYPAGRMVEEAVKAIDTEVNFSDFDSNNDGMVDFVYLFFAGKGATTGGNVDKTIWPHAFTLQAAIGETIKLDGVEINRYATSSELGAGGKLSGVGTFCHEFGHVLGFPDLYDTSNNGTRSDCFTPGTFDTMDAGNYNNDEHTPCHFSSYERYALEWMKPTEITGGGKFTLLPLDARNFAYKINTLSNPQEYFLLEARNQQGYDKYLEGQGLLVWHIDFDLRVWQQNTPNNTASHQRIDIVEADDSKDTATRSGDTFPGVSGICEFTKDITPTFTDWSGNGTGFDLSSIRRNPDGSVTFEILSDNGKMMDGSALASPIASVSAVTSSYATIEWAPVDGADSYSVSVYPLSKFDGTHISEYLSGYYYKDLGKSTTVTVGGLTPGERYGAVIYALSNVNASRTELPLEFVAMAGDFKDVKTRLYDTKADGGTELRWDKVDGADSYLLTVAVMTPGETAETITTGFDDNKLPEGWYGTGKYETRSSNCGVSAPSYRLSGDCYLETSAYDRDIKSISFWSRKRYDDADGYLDIFGVGGDGSLSFICRTADLASEGGAHTIDVPAGVRQLRLQFTMLTSGLDLYIDDVAVALTDGLKETPVSGYDAKSVAGESIVVTGLDDNVNYGAYVVPVKNGEPGSRSQVLNFIPSMSPSGVDEISADFTDGLFYVSAGQVVSTNPESVYSVYALDGRCVASKVKGSTPLGSRGVYVVKSGDKTFKVMY